MYPQDTLNIGCRNDMLQNHIGADYPSFTYSITMSMKTKKMMKRNFIQRSESQMPWRPVSIRAKSVSYDLSMLVMCASCDCIMRASIIRCSRILKPYKFMS